MPKEKQVVSLEIAQRLHKLGVKGESIFYWSIPNPEMASNEKERIVLDKYCEVQLCHKQTDWGEKFDALPAYTSAELGEMLPVQYVNYPTRISTTEWHWLEPCDMGFKDNISETEANARGLLLCYLKENNLI